MSSVEQQTATDSNQIRSAAGGKMRAIVQDQYGETVDVLRLEEIDPPQIGGDDVLVRVQAASVHIGDWHVMDGPAVPAASGGVRTPRAKGPCARHGCRGDD